MKFQLNPLALCLWILILLFGYLTGYLTFSLWIIAFLILIGWVWAMYDYIKITNRYPWMSL